MKNKIFNIDVESLLWLPDWCVYWKDVEGCYLGCNDTMAERFRFPSRRTLEQNTDYYLPVKKAEADCFRENDRKIIKQNIAAQFYEPETLFKRKTLQLSIKTPLCNNDGIVVGVLGLSHELQQSTVNNIFSGLSAVSGLSNSIGAFANSFSQYKTNQEITSRQEECLYYLVQGMSIKQIAQQIKLSPRTVEHYLDAVKNKLGCNSRSELIAKALQLPAIKKRLLSV